jgi:hypothetical protein
MPALLILFIMTTFNQSFAQGDRPRDTTSNKSINQECQCALDEMNAAEKFSLNLKAWLFSKRMINVDSEKDNDLARARKFIGKQVSIESYTFARPLDSGFKQAMIHGCEGTRGKLVSIDRDNLVLEIHGHRKKFVLMKSYSEQDGNVRRYIDIKNYMSILPLE